MAKTKTVKEKRIQTEKFDRPEQFYEHPDLDDINCIINEPENYDFEEVEIIEAYTHFKTATFTRKELEKFVEMKDEDAFEEAVANQIEEKNLSDFPNNLIILSDTKKFKNNIGEGLAEIKLKSKKIPSNITTIKNFHISQEKDFLSYGTNAKNLYLILLEKGTI